MRGELWSVLECQDAETLPLTTKVAPEVDSRDGLWTSKQNGSNANAVSRVVQSVHVPCVPDYHRS